LALEELGPGAYRALLASRCGVELPEGGADVAAYLHDEVMPRLLTTVYQASASSGSVTREAAAALAADLGSSHHEWSIAPLVEGYTALANSLDPGHPLTWEHDDITLQNIQARARLPGIWMVANREGKLLLETSNLSEASVGYCTMDGDTAGGLAPIGGIKKSVVRRVNRHLAERGMGIGSWRLALPGLLKVCAQQPTAELRPGGTQTDEADLMPYELLDHIKDLTQRDRLVPREILAQLLGEPRFRDLGEARLREFVRRYFTLHARSQWKREKQCPAFHIDPQGASPKGEWRLPVLSDGFADLLEGI
nr:NAD(+) synthase [Succinivibrionaceae bacterium]